MSHRALGLALTTLLLLTLSSILVAAGPRPAGATIHPAVWDTLEAEGEGDILVVLRQQADLSAASALPSKEAKGRYVYDALRAVALETQQGLRSMLDSQHVDYHLFYIVNAIQVRASSTLVRLLATRHDVARILPNPRVKGVPDLPAQPSDPLVPEGIEPNLTRVHADDVWDLGYTGQGIVVAGQDTGYDWEHPALKDHYRGWDGASVDHDYNWHDAIHSGGGVCGPDAAEPCDDYGHGTHTMGIAVGDDGAGNQIGMAPGAQWIGCRNMNVGVGTPATYMECFEFFLAPYPLGGDPLVDGDPLRAPHVVNNSWACPPSEGCSAETLEASVEALRQAGIIVVVSAGNQGYSGCETVQYPPAIYPQSFSVGAFSHTTDRIAGFSSRGPVTYQGDTYRKPDITAPGVGIRSSVPGGGYGYKQGTSMAAPHVAGAVALLLSAAPGYSGNVDGIEHLLTSTAEPVTTTETCGADGPTDVPNNTWGWGILDTLSAVQAATSGTLQGTVSDIETGSPIAGAEVTADPVPGPAGPLALTDPNGRYTLTLAAGTYTVTADAIGFLPQAVTNVEVVTGEVKTQDIQLTPARIYYVPLMISGP